ncbi:MAG: hypothetical protein AAGA48_20385 [Myxococcota bacterium]
MRSRGTLVVHVILAWLVAVLVGTASNASAQGNDRCTKAECIDRRAFYEGFRRFNRTHPLAQDPKQLSRKSFNAMQGILNRWDTSDELTDTRWLAYIIATVFWETGGNLFPVREGLCEDAECALDYLEGLWRKRLVRQRYWEPDSTTGQSYYGRGQVQLTHLVNYWRVGIELSRTQNGDRFADLDRRLVNQADLALREWVSTAALMEGMVRGWYNAEYGKGLASYINADITDDRIGYLEARRTVNGLDKRDLLADFALEIHQFIKAVPASAPHASSAEEATARMTDVPAGRVTGADGKVRRRAPDAIDEGRRVGPVSEEDDYELNQGSIDFSNPIGPIRNLTGVVGGGAAAAAQGNLRTPPTKKQIRQRKKRRRKRKKRQRKKRRQQKKNRR